MCPLLHLGSVERSSMNTTIDRKRTRRAFTGAICGHLIEWYDYGIYGFLAIYVGAAFFASDDPAVNLLSSFAVFALSFFARPIGGMVLGPLADRLGRRRTLVISLTMMSGATFSIGLIPSHATIGIAAPIILILARCVQGFSAGGEIGTVASFLSEYAKPGKRAFATCWSMVIAITGLLLGGVVANGMTLFLGADQMYAGAWRIPFLIAGPLGLIAMVIRLKLEESPEFQAMSAKGETSAAPLRELRHHVRPVLLIMGICTLHSSIFYLVLTYMTNYLGTTLKFSSSSIFGWIVVSGVLAAAVMPIGGLISDRVGRRPFLLVVGTLATVAMGAMFAAAPNESNTLFLSMLLVVAVLFGLFDSSTTALFTELLPTRVRTTGIALGYNVAVAVFGGTAPFVATLLITRTDNIASPAYFFVFTGIIALIALFVLRPSDLVEDFPVEQEAARHEEALGAP